MSIRDHIRYHWRDIALIVFCIVLIVIGGCVEHMHPS